MHARTHTHTHTHTHIHSHTHTHTRTHTHAYVQIHTYTHTRKGYIFIAPRRVREKAAPMWFEMAASFSIDVWVRPKRLFLGTAIEGLSLSPSHLFFLILTPSPSPFLSLPPTSFLSGLFAFLRFYLSLDLACAHSPCLYVSVSLCFSLALSLCLSVCLSLSPSLSLSLCLSLSVFLSLSCCLSLCVFFSRSISFSTPPFQFTCDIYVYVHTYMHWYMHIYVCVHV